MKLLNSVRFRYVLMLLVGLVLADGVITEYLIYSGVATESNPFLRGLLADGNFMAIKVAGALLSAAILAGLNRNHHQMAAITTWSFIVFYTWVVYWNIGGTLLNLNF